MTCGLDEETEVRWQVVEALPADWFSGVNLALRLHIGGRHQPYVAAELREFPCPMVRAAARLDADERPRERSEEGEDFGAPELLRSTVRCASSTPWT